MGFAVGGVLGSLGTILIKIVWGFGPESGDVVIGFVVMMGILGFWLWYPTEDRVHLAAIAYAERLLDSATPLKAKTRGKRAG
jgi:hypothetical protein